MAVTHDIDEVSLGTFLLEVCRRAPQGASKVSEASLRDPLGAMITRIRCTPHTMEHRVLARLLQGVSEESATQSTFRVAEIAAFSPALLQLVSAFINDYLNGRYDKSIIRSILATHEISTPTDTDTPFG